MKPGTVVTHRQVASKIYEADSPENHVLALQAANFGMTTAEAVQRVNSYSKTLMDQARREARLCKAIEETAASLQAAAASLLRALED